MRLSNLRILPALALLAPLLGCGGSWFDEPRAAWRSEVEARCVASGRVVETEFVKREPELDGPGSCGADSPFRVFGALAGTVWFSEPVLMNCPMTAAVDDWLNEVVQPNAMQIYGVPVRELKTAGTYSCRRIYNRTIGSMSEHAFLNAIDLTGFVLEDGRAISVRSDWNGGDQQKRLFLRSIGAQSCNIFTTVLGPDYNAEHKDHFHLDLAYRSKTSKHACHGGPGNLMSYAPAGKPSLDRQIGDQWD